MIYDLFSVAINHIPAKFYELFSVGSLFVMLCVKVKNGGCRHVKFHFCSILWHNFM